MKQVSHGVAGHCIPLGVDCNICLPFSLDKTQNKSDLWSVKSEGLGLYVLFFLVWVVCWVFGGCPPHVQVYQLQVYIINLSCRSNWSWWNYQELLIQTS